MLHLATRTARLAIRRKAVRTYTLASQHKTEFEAIVGSDHVLSASDDMASYTTDWTKTYSGGSLVCFPKTTHEVSSIMKLCQAANIGVVPQGGNTGLVGGAVGTNKGELILSMKRMNQVLDVDSSAGVVTCEAGCVLEWLNSEVGKQGFAIPLDLGAKGSCMIGGNVATNAGGLRVLKYGSLQGNVLGLEVVLADGTVLDMLRTLRKDNCGLHSKHLFVGSEGALGVITKVSLLLVTKPTYSSVFFAKLGSFDKVPELLRAARRRLGDTLTAFEFMDRNAIDLVRRADPGLLHSVTGSVLPVPQPSAPRCETPGGLGEEGEQGVPGEVAVLLECTGTDVGLDQQRVDAFAESVMEEGLVEDAVISMSSDQEKDLWKIRENLTVCLAQLSRGRNPLYAAGTRKAVPGVVEQGRLFKYDLSVRLQDTAELLRELKQRLLSAGFRMKGVSPQNVQRAEAGGADEDVALLLSACELEFCNYGHIADQNIHLNILASVRIGELGVAGKEMEVVVPQGGLFAKYKPAPAAGSAAASAPSVHAVMVPAGGQEGQGQGQGGGMCVREDSLAAYTALVRGEVNRHVFDVVLELRGSISAEHGVGAQKVGAMHWARSPAELAVMRAVKAALDPAGILNPGKLLP